MGNRRCCICNFTENDILNLGEIKNCGNLNAHYYCLLLASTIQQSGNDNEGILGFLRSDILAEIKRTNTRKCNYCQRKGAAVICSTRNCKIAFHLPCGIKNGSGHQFYGRFLSMCHKHRRRQKFKIPTEPVNCPICYETINFKLNNNVISAPCCKKKSYFHKSCIQQMALSAGYFCKCPMCNNTKVFQKTIKENGVFIPDRDASWELEPNAFEELLYRHEECNVKVCVCRGGRTYTNMGPWNIVLCNCCGSQGTHMHCSQLRKKQEWTCERCQVQGSSSKSASAAAPTPPPPPLSLPPNTAGDSTHTDDEIDIISLSPQPSTSRTIHETEFCNKTVKANTASSRKRKRNKNLQTMKKKEIKIGKLETITPIINIDSEDSDVEVVGVNSVVAKRSQQQELNLVITNVRTVDESDDDDLEYYDAEPAENNRNNLNVLKVSTPEFQQFMKQVRTVEQKTEKIIYNEYMYPDIKIFPSKKDVTQDNDIVIID